MVGKFEVKIAIVDDKQGSREKINERLKNFFLQLGLEDIKFIIDTYEGGVSFLSCKKQYDLILLDYEMPDKNGLQVAAELEVRSIRPRVLFISGYDQIIKPMQKATQLSITAGFILKSDSEEEFQFQVNHALKKILNVPWIEFEYYLVEPDHGIERKREKRRHYNKKIDVRKISHIESTAKDVVTVYTEDEEFKTRESLKILFSKLPEDKFKYSDRGHIVNLGFVHSMGKKSIYLITDEEISLTGSYKEAFQVAYDNYLLEGFDD